MRTSIARSKVLCKNQTCPALPQSARSVAEEEKEEEEEKMKMMKMMTTKNSEIACDNILLVWRDEGTY